MKQDGPPATPRAKGWERECTNVEAPNENSLQRGDLFGGGGAGGRAAPLGFYNCVPPALFASPPSTPSGATIVARS